MVGRNHIRTTMKRVVVAVSLAPLIILAFGCGGEAEPASPGPPPLSERMREVPRSEGDRLTCLAGDIRECHVTREQANGVVFCATGAEVCVGDEWSSCMDADAAARLSSEVVGSREAVGGAGGQQ